MKGLRQASAVALDPTDRLLGPFSHPCADAAQQPMINVGRAAQEAEMEVEFTRGMQALIMGALRLSEDNGAGRRPGLPPMAAPA